MFGFVLKIWAVNTNTHLSWRECCISDTLNVTADDEGAAARKGEDDVLLRMCDLFMYCWRKTATVLIAKRQLDGGKTWAEKTFTLLNNVEQFSCRSGPLQCDRCRQCKIPHTQESANLGAHLIFHFSAYYINVANGWHKLCVSLSRDSYLISSLTYLCLHLQHIQRFP